ncbi:MAG: DHH family phosphoesterase [Erysipelotrichaceae bacterium]|nr:DHH family phosphoesterase [Erysipelotrichaceae bacterium]MBQ1346684.1 DHH family phosphoesterase [Erysipelotrichaceae bacterium]MBQ1775997.1 DHH family phosphoesterase [Erysipelotrichaceae bacterium]MBQ2233016.1 DHH family phosphoesterase [Erysipelotrichaceae bacterium]MBQ9158318.1 DHH family phosphoesterase [Erysipelotrichaceae bacterium]
MKRTTFITALSAVASVSIILALLVLGLFFGQNVLLPAVITAVFILLLAMVFYSLDLIKNETNKQIENQLELAYKEVLSHGDIGIIVYDENYEINFMSDFFLKRNMNHLGEKVLNWLPELQDMLKNEANNQIIIINDEKFSVRKINNAFVLTFKNITKEYDLNKKLEDDAPVVGLLSYDNYDEVEMSEDELAYVNTNIKVPVIDYFRNFGVVYKTLKNSRMLLLMNETTFEAVRNDRFSILNKVRKVAKEGDVDVTLSMAFAEGSDDYDELDSIAEELLELAQTRGGDQVAVRKAGGDATFFGGTTEAREKQSKTKVRVTANAIKDLIEKSSNVIILGHKEMDADCVASAICMSDIVLSLNKKCYIVSRSGGMETMIAEVVNRFSAVLENKHHFISESEGLDLLNENTLVIMVDHHSAAQSGGAAILKNAKRIIILDHHRRRADLDVIAMMLYIEAAASSATEIIYEMVPYFSKHIEISSEEANIMYLGIMIDTDHFRVRTGSRTFDVVKQLRRAGADPMLCDTLSQEPYDNVIERSRIINAGKLYRKGVVVASIAEGNFPRSIASQACDALVRAKDIEAAFVICNSDKNETIISARSRGTVNVQVIMEKMNGGGHMTAAGLQVNDSSVPKMENELLKVLDEYFEGEKQL